MNYLAIISPLFVAGLIFLAYLGGKKAGRKEAELERIKKEMEQSNEADKIINNNNNLTDSEFASWVQDHNKK